MSQTPQEKAAMTHDETPITHEISPNLGPSVCKTSPPLEETLDRFYQVGPGFHSVKIQIEPPDRALELLERLGSSPFPRRGFPVIGFLATTYDKVSRYALERGQQSPTHEPPGAGEVRTRD